MRSVATYIVRPFWNSREHRVRAFWRLVGELLLFVLISLLLSIAAGWLLFQVGGIIPGVASGIGGLIGVVVALLSVFGSMWLAARFLDRRPFVDFGFRLNTAWWQGLGFGLALGAVLMVGIFLTEWAAGWVVIGGYLQTPAPGQSFALAILVPIVVYLCVGIYEEMLSRGYLLHNLSEGFNFPPIGPLRAIVLAWLLSSGLFGLAHAANPNATAVSTINIAVAGLFLGLGYILTGELAIPIGLHITWNFFQGNVFGFPVSGTNASPATFIAISQRGPDLWTGGAFGPEAGLLGILAMLAGSLLILLWVYWRRGRLVLCRSLPEPPVRKTVRKGAVVDASQDIWMDQRRHEAE